MTRVDPRQTLTAALREQMGTLRERAQAQRAAGTASAAPQAQPGLSAALVQGVRALDPSDPDRRHKAVRLFLQAQLAREFGADLLNDPELPQLLDAVQQQMRADPQLAAAVDAAGDLLLAGQAP